MTDQQAPKRPRGRPPADPAHQRKVRSIRLTDAHWQRLSALGGHWLEFQLDRAPPGTEWMKEQHEARKKASRPAT